MKVRIGTRLMLGATLGALVIVLALSVAAYHIARRGLKEQITSHLTSVARSRAAHVRTFLRGHKEMVRLAATSLALGDWLRRLQAAGVHKAAVTQDLNARLATFNEPEHQVYEILLLDCHGKVVASSNPKSVGLDKSTDASFVGARNGPFVKGAHLSAAGGRQSLAVSAPLFDRERGHLLGVLVTRIDMAGLNAVCTERTGLGETGETYLINKYGFMITPSRFRQGTFLKLKMDTENARKCLADQKAMRRGTLAEEHEHVAAEFTDYRGIRVLGVHAHVPEMEWGLLAEIDAGEAFAPIARLKRILATFAALFAAGSLLGAYVFARRISRPIHELHVGSERLGAGELDFRLAIKTGDEIEQLADEFNRMAARLSESYASLEQKVADRTAELAQANAQLRGEIAERKRTEQQNAELLLRQQVLLENAPAAIFLKDIEGRYTVVNRGCVELLPRHVEDPVGKRDRDLYPKSLAAKLERENRLVMKQGRTIEKEERIRLRSGRVADMAVTLAPVRIEGGTIVGMVGLAVDITERKRAEKALQDSRVFLQTVIDAVSTSMMVIDRDYRITMANRAARQLNGGKDPAAARLKCHQVSHRRDAPCTGEDGVCPLRQVVKTKAPVVVTHTHYDADGNTFLVEVVAAPIFDASGEVVQIVESCQDITERKQAEAELEKYAGEMEQLNRSLEQSNQNLRDFTHAVSHDLQEPLRKVHAFAEFLVEDCGDHIPDAGKEHLRRMQSATVRMKDLIRHLLELSRVDTRGSNLAPTDPAEVIADVLDMFGERVREYDAKIEVQSELPRVLADATQLGQVFQNLIGNALKFRAPERKPQIRITAEQTGGEVAFSVADNGMGIEQRFLEKIFAVFQRLHTRDEYEGTGVGLALCRKIIERHGGRIWAESEPGKGSTFRFTVRRAPQRKEEENDRRRTKAVGTGAARRG